MKDLPKSMLKPRRARIQHGPGEAWYYITRSGLEICVAAEKGRASSQVVRLTRRQMEQALKVIEEAGR